MAKILITLDTETGEHEIKAGGSVIDNVCEVHIGCGKFCNSDCKESSASPYCYVEICQRWVDESDGLSRYVRLTASEKDSELVNKTINHKSLAEFLFPKYNSKSK